MSAMWIQYVASSRYALLIDSLPSVRNTNGRYELEMRKGGEKMKVVVSATGEDLDAQIDPRFGRCQYFIIVDIDTMDYKAVSNESAMATGGAGIQAAQKVASMGVGAVITGNIGPNAFQTLSASGIRIITGASGIVRHAIDKFKKGGLANTSQPTVPGHYGMGGGSGRGMGRGMDRGMGPGRGGEFY